MPSNPESILDTVKKAIGFDSEYTAFDLDVMMFINATFGSLLQLGVGSDSGFFISDNTTTWSDYVTDMTFQGMVKSYLVTSVRLAFDPPATSFAIEAFEKQRDELGWRINVAFETANPPNDPFGTTTTTTSGGGTTTAVIVPVVVRLGSASAVTPDATAGNVFYLELIEDCTINPPANGRDGQHITLELDSGGYAVTWGFGWNFGSAGIPTLSSDKVDIVSSVYREEINDWYSGFSSGF